MGNLQGVIPTPADGRGSIEMEREEPEILANSLLSKPASAGSAPGIVPRKALA